MRSLVFAGLLLPFVVACGGQEPPPKPVDAKPVESAPPAAPSSAPSAASSSEAGLGNIGKLGGGKGFGGGGGGGDDAAWGGREVKIPAPTTKPHPKGSARLGKVTVAGSPNAPIEKAIGEAQKNVLICYENALADDPKLTGKVSPEFLVPDEGNTLVKAEGESDLPKPVSECIIEALRQAPYPKPAKGKVISFTAPMVLSVAK